MINQIILQSKKKLTIYTLILNTATVFHKTKPVISFFTILIWRSICIVTFNCTTFC